MVKLVFAGKSNALIHCLEHALGKMNKEEIAVVPSNSDGDSDTWQYSVRKYCADHNITLLQLEDVYALENVALVSIQYDRILRPARFKTNRLFNIHFSLLPFYKGVFPTIWPILNGESESGVTLHYIDAGIDTGDIIDHRKVALNRTTTARTLYTSCQQLAREIFVDNFDALLSGEEVDSRMQHGNIGSYYSKHSITAESRILDLNKTACEVDAQVRAFHFREFQLAIWNENKIFKTTIHATRSVAKPGTIIEETDKSVRVATVDYDISLHFDFGNELFEAIESQDLVKFNKVVGLQSDLNIRNARGWTPLMIAAFLNQSDMVKELVQRGADIHAKNYKGTSVLMYAKSGIKDGGSTASLEFLLSSGADPDDRDVSGKFLLEYAQEEGNPEVINLLKKYSKLSKVFDK